MISAAILIATTAWWIKFEVLPSIQPPPSMQGEFNIAVAEFTVLDANGRELEADDGSKIADFIFQRLEKHLNETGLENIRYEIRDPKQTGVVTGQDPEVRAQTARNLAKDINAHIIIYGAIISDGENSQVEPEFFVSYEGFQEAGEILGPYALGKPLSIALPFDPARAQDIDNPALSARTNALSLLTIGLAYYSNDDFEMALDYFSSAQDTKGWLDSAGKEVLYMLLGNIYIRMASRDKNPDYLSSAHDAYVSALQIDPTYIRASLAQANVLYLEALGDPTNPSFDTVDQEKLNSAQIQFEEALKEKNPPAGINVYPKAHFGLGQIYLVKALPSSQEDWLEKARKEFAAVVEEYESGNEAIIYYSSHAYARLGLIERQLGNADSAAEYYQKAISIASPYYQGFYYTKLGDLYHDSGDNPQAIWAYENAVKKAEFYGDEARANEYQKRLDELQAQQP